MKVIFMLPGGMIEWQVPQAQQADFNFVSMVTNIRAHGFFFSDGFYIRHELLVGMSLSTDEVVAPVVRKDMN